MLDFLKINWLAIPHIEADDIVASVARNFCKKASSSIKFK